MGSVNKPSRIIQFNKSDHTIKPATLLAKKRNGEIIGQIKYTNLQFSFVGKGLDEISFQVHKKVDNVECSFWDKLQGMLIVDYVDYGQFEATFTINDADETIKNCTAISLETELSQYTLHEEAHYNDEQAITTSLSIDKDSSGTYIPLMVCDTSNPDHSVLHRILKDKAPHWSVGRVPKYINVNGMVYETNGFQREFNFEGKTIYAALQDIQEECNCLFTFNTYDRQIDMWNIEECIFEISSKKVVEGAYYSDGKLYDKNSNELSSNLYAHADGIGNDTGIFITKKQLAQDFTVNEDKDSVKNCFYVKGGDDVMTNIVAAANVTGDNYIMMFDQFQYEDMPTSLKEKIEKYQANLKDQSEKFYKVGGYYIYDSSCQYKDGACRNKNGKVLTDAIYKNGKVYVLDNYVYKIQKNNSWGDTSGGSSDLISSGDINIPTLSNGVYDRYDQKLSSDNYIYTDDTGLYVKRCQVSDRLDWVKNSKFPNITMSQTTAKDQFNIINNWFHSSTPPKLIDGSTFCQKVIIQNTCSTTSYDHVTSTIETMLGVICDSRYEIKMLKGDNYPSSCTNINADQPTGVWKGYFSVQNIADDNDKQSGEISINIQYIKSTDIDKSKDYLEQKFNIALAKTDVVDLDYYDKTDEELLNLFRQYNYNSLCSFTTAFKSCVDTLDSIYPKSDSIVDSLSDSYTTLRERYWHLYQLIEAYRPTVNAVCTELETQLKDLDTQISTFRSQFNMRTYLGETDYKLFRSYIREDEYSNENYTSEGLNTYQILEKAKELLDVANTEIKKACVLQRTVSANLNNIFALERYKKLYDDFAIFNYIRAEIDGMIYKLRIVQLDYNMDDLGTLSVKFSDSVTYTDGTISDLQSMKQAVSDMSTSFSSTTYQAKQGASAMSQFDRLYSEGINSADFVVKNSTDEEVTIDSSGINCKSQNDIGVYGLHQCRVIGSGVYLTDTGWKTPPKAALGLMKLNNIWRYGLFADAIIGKMIVGEQLSISNGNESVEITGSGIVLDGGSITWKKPMDKSGVDGLEDDLTKLKENIDNNAQDFTNAIKKAQEDLQSQIDGEITSWFEDYDPTVNNEPASTWKTDSDKVKHEGDLFYNTATGRAFRYIYNSSTKKHEWSIITDEAISKALADAATAQDTADHKRRVFVNTPYVPYDIGDLWAQGSSGDLYKCKTAKTDKQTYSLDDWEKATKYTDDSALKTFINGDYAEYVSETKKQLDQKTETWYQSTDPSSSWNTEELKKEHVGDMWYDTTTTSKKTYIYVRNSDGTYGWKQQEIPQDVFDTIDGKAQIYIYNDYESKQPHGYNKGDMWILQVSNEEGKQPQYPKYKIGTLLIAEQDAPSPTGYAVAHWVEKVKYTDDTKANAVEESLTAYKKEIAEFQTKVDTELSVAGVTKIGDDYVYSPKISAGYLYISKDGCSVEIDPSQSYNTNNTNVMKVTANNEDVFYITRKGDAYFKGEIEATSGTFHGKIEAESGYFKGDLQGAGGTFSGSLTSNRIKLNPNDDEYRGLIRMTDIDVDDDNTSYKTISIANDYGSDTDNLGINFSFKNVDTSKYYATAAFGIYKKNGSTFVKSFSNLYCGNKVYLGGSTTYWLNSHQTGDIEDGVSCNGRIHAKQALSVGDTIYTDHQLSVKGSAYVSGDLYANDGFKVTSCRDGHSIQFGWTGSRLMLYVDYPGSGFATTMAYEGDLAGKANAVHSHTLASDVGVQWETDGSQPTYKTAAGGTWRIASKAYVDAKISSDKRVKTDFKNLPNCINDIFDSFSVSQYKFKDKNAYYKGFQFGETAQHVNQIFESHGLDSTEYGITGTREVYEDEKQYIDDGVYNYINTDNVLWLCVDQIQKLKKQIAQLKEQINGEA